MGGDEHHGHGHGGVHGPEDFRQKVWTMTGGPYCRPKHWRRNTAIALFGIFLVCIPIAKKSAELELICVYICAGEFYNGDYERAIHARPS